MAVTETKQAVSIESFSYRWLVNLKPSFENLGDSFRHSFDASDEALFIEMDPKLPPSKRFFRVPQDLSFDFPVSHSPLEEAHADELIFNGYLMPLFINKMEPNDASESTSDTPISSSDHEDVHSSNKSGSASLGRCRSLSKQILHKYLDFLRPLCQKIRFLRTGSHARHIVNRPTRVCGHKVKNWDYSPATSPWRSVSYSVDDWRRSCDSESSIHEAVLHCKRTIGK